MKNYSRKPAPSKFLRKFDQELMNILMDDLNDFREKTPNIRKVGEQQQLIAA